MADTHLLQVLRAEMQRLGLTQHGLAIEAGLHRDAVRNIFRKKSGMPRLATLKALAAVLDVSVDYLGGAQAEAPIKLEKSGDGPFPRIPSRKPGLQEWMQVQRAWNAASPEGRRALTYMARTIAAAEGIDLDKPKVD